MSPSETLKNKKTKCCKRCGCQKVAAITSRISGELADFISDSSRLKSLTDSYGSPLNVVFPEAVPKNISDFNQVFSTQQIIGKTLLTSKPNKSKAILKQIALNETNVDVSSEGSLIHALSSGIAGARIQATGPKSKDYLLLALQHDTTISINSLSELKNLINLKNLLKNNSTSKTRLLIRVNSSEATGMKDDNFSSLLFGVEK